MKSRIIDITPLVHPGMAVWDGDTPFQINKVLEMEKGDPWNSGSIQMSLHTGAHADAPWHFLPDRERISDVPLENYLGPVMVYTHLGVSEIKDVNLKNALVKEPERLLLRTSPKRDFDQIPEEFAYFSESAARLLADSGLKLVGIDTPSVDSPTAKVLTVHNVFGNAGIALLENLNLSEVDDGFYELIALPLKIEKADASPVRAVLRELST